MIKYHDHDAIPKNVYAELQQVRAERDSAIVELRELKQKLGFGGAVSDDTGSLSRSVWGKPKGAAQAVEVPEADDPGRADGPPAAPAIPNYVELTVGLQTMHLPPGRYRIVNHELHKVTETGAQAPEEAGHEDQPGESPGTASCPYCDNTGRVPSVFGSATLPCVACKKPCKDGLPGGPGASERCEAGSEASQGPRDPEVTCQVEPAAGECENCEEGEQCIYSGTYPSDPCDTCDAGSNFEDEPYPEPQPVGGEK